MKIFDDIKKSVYGPAFYAELEEEPFSYSLKYFLKYVLIVSVLAAVILSIVFGPRAKMFLNDVGPEIIAAYPDELEVVIKDGEASTNVEEPYFIAVPEKLKELDDSDGGSVSPDPDDFEHLLVIDTRGEVTIEQFEEYSTFALLGRNNFFAYDNNGSISVTPLDEVPDVVVDEEQVAAWAGVVESFAGVASVILLPIGAFIMSYIVLASHLIYLIVGALFIWLLAKIMGRSIRYGKAYQYGLHAITLGLVVFPLLNFVLSWGGFPFDFTLLMLIVFWANYKDIEPRVEVEPIS